MILVTDSVGAEMLVEDGYIDRNVRRAIELGLDPVKAIQMVTINPAEHFRLDAHVGSIAPGRCADLVLLPNVRTIRPTWVMSRGHIVARDGQLTTKSRAVELPAEFRNSVGFGRQLSDADFAIPLPDGETRQARVIQYVTGLVTKETRQLVRGMNGTAEVLELGTCTLACIDRLHESHDSFLGWASGYGLRSGAVATTWSWESTSMVVLGADRSDMALAANRLAEIQGGAVIVANGEVIAEVAAPIGGIISEAPMEDLVMQLSGVKSALHNLGCPWPDPLLAVDVLTTAAIPHFRISDRGYARLRDGTPAGLWINE
jgi:adenine deaminase